jgi:hypothetical protein
MICKPCRLAYIRYPYGKKNGWTYEARTTSRPQGDIDIEPTGLSSSKDPSFSKVGLLNAFTNSETISSRIIIILKTEIYEYTREGKTVDTGRVQYAGLSNETSEKICGLAGD